MLFLNLKPRFFNHYIAALELTLSQPIFDTIQYLVHSKVSLKNFCFIRDSTKPLEVFEQRSMSEIITPSSSPSSFPKINYKSFVTSVDDTLYDYTSSTIDQIASKYVPREMLLQHQEQREVKNKTVKFEGVYEWKSSNHKDGVILSLIHI